MATVVFVLLSLPGIEYLFVAGYIVVQYIVLATAWNILGGYTGYVNFGSAAFFAIGAYSSVALITFGNQLEDLVPESLDRRCSLIFPLPIPVLIVVSGVVSGMVGFGMGYLTLRLRGAFFAIATLGAGGGAADFGGQLGFRRRLARRLCRAPASNFPA